MRAFLSCFFIIFREGDLENVSPSVRENLRCLWKISCSRLREFGTPNSNAIIRKTKIFSQFFVLESTSNFKCFKKKIIVIVNLFAKLQIVKNLVRPLFKKCCFRTRSKSQHVKASRLLVKPPWERCYHVFSSFSGKLIWKMFPLVLLEILGVLVKTLTADNKYPFPNCGKLLLPIQMILPEKRKTFSEFFVPFLESTSNFKRF